MCTASHSVFAIARRERDVCRFERLSFTTTLLIHPEFENEEINNLTDIQRKIIDVIRNNPQITLLKMQGGLNVGHTTLERNLKILREIGIVERTGARKNGSWIVKE